jgi:hypothetical protein
VGSEKGIFASFLEIQPDFAGNPIIESKHNGNDAPDILCVDAQGARIGVEVTEWLDETQIRDYARWENLLRRAAEAPQDWSVDVHLKQTFGARCNKEDENRFTKELSSLIERGASSPNAEKSDPPMFAFCYEELARNAPTVAKYCDRVAGYKMGSAPHQLVSGGSFSEEAAQALRESISKKTGKAAYAEAKLAYNLDRLILLVFYDQGILKNTPNLNVDAERVGAETMAAAPGAFDGAFVFMFPGAETNGARRAHRIFPL